MRYHLALAGLVFVFSTGFTSCEYFTQTTVPAVDTTPPAVWDAVWVGGEYKAFTGGASSADYKIEPGETVLAIGAGTDDGGTYGVVMYTGWSLTCCDGSVCSLTQPLSTPIVETQPGHVGDTVSNGVWAYAEVTAPSCGDNATRGSFSYYWSTYAEDFHGNRSQTGHGELYYSFD